MVLLAGREPHIVRQADRVVAMPVVAENWPLYQRIVATRLRVSRVAGRRLLETRLTTCSAVSALASRSSSRDLISAEPRAWSGDGGDAELEHGQVGAEFVVQFGARSARSAPRARCRGAASTA